METVQSSTRFFLIKEELLKFFLKAVLYSCSLLLLNIDKTALSKQSLMNEQPVLYEIWNTEEFCPEFTPYKANGLPLPILKGDKYLDAQIVYRNCPSKEKEIR